MPQKLNKAGQMQNYVPAGHGDASGEYGDSEGNNIHFKVFKKPEPQIQQSQKQVSSEDYDKLSKKSKENITKKVNKYVRLKQEINKDNFIRDLRWFGGDYGDLSNFTDEQLSNIIDYLSEKVKSFTTSDEFLHFKEGKNWKLTQNKDLYDFLGIKLYTSEEKETKIREENAKLVENSQKSQDKEIQKLYDKNNCVVCFGKGYKENDLNEILEAQKIIVGEFPELNGFVKMMGDRTNLEKFINAVNSQKTFSEEEIQAQVEKIKKSYFLGLPSEEILRNRAIEKLQGKVEITRVNNAYAYWSGSEKAMIYMPKMKNITQEQRNAEFEDNFKSSNHHQSTNYHEMGHAIDDLQRDLFDKVYNKQTDWHTKNEVAMLRQKFNSQFNELKQQNFNKDYKEIFSTKFKEKYGISPDGLNAYKLSYEINEFKKELAKNGIKQYNLSQYGSTNANEFTAESFSAYFTKMNNPLANKVVELYKNYINDLRRYL